jgi:AcrR family transcriptional regulator
MTTTAALPRTPPDTGARILDAAFDRVMQIGLARTTVEDVARAAGLSRQTIYRYFPSKEHLVTALVLREEERFLDGIRRAFAEDPNLEVAIADGILFCLRFARQHPLLDRLLETDPETLLPYLTTRGTPVINRAREVLKGLLVQKAWIRADLLDTAIDAATRTLISYALTPPDRRPEEVARDLARILTLALAPKEASPR